MCLTKMLWSSNKLGTDIKKGMLNDMFKVEICVVAAILFLCAICWPFQFAQGGKWASCLRIDPHRKFSHTDFPDRFRNGGSRNDPRTGDIDFERGM